MDYIKEYKEMLREELLSLDAAKPMKDNRVMVRCPYCGDSIKSFDHGHLGILIDMNDDKIPLLYRCLRCDDSGIFTPTQLSDLGINNSDLRKFVLEYNAQATKTNTNNLSLKIHAGYKYNIPVDTYDKRLAQEKVDYINWRLGVNKTIDDYIKLRVVLNFAEFLVYNKIEKYTRKKEVIQNLHYNYVGFLTTLRQHIVFRSINGKDPRYDVYAMHNYSSKDNLTKLYSIPFSYDLMSIEEFNVYLAEGTFDILGVYFNVCNEDTNNKVYIGICGCGYKAAIKYLINIGLFGLNVNLHIFSDKDKEPRFYKKLFEKTSKYYKSINLYYNDFGKDFGVPKNKIVLVRQRC